MTLSLLDLRTQVLVLSYFLISACGAQTTTDRDEGESQFLSACVSSSDCPSEFECLANRCTVECRQNDDCNVVSRDAVCVSNTLGPRCEVPCHDNFDCSAVGTAVACEQGLCRPLPPDACNEGGQSYADGESWGCSDNCDTCSCDRGRIRRTAVECAPGCDEGGQEHAANEVWRCADGCNTCTCQGQTILGCQPLECYYERELHSDGDVWVCDNGCNACHCSRGRLTKLELACERTTCEPVEFAAGTLVCEPQCSTCTCPDDSTVSGGEVCPGGDTSCQLSDQDLSYPQGTSWWCTCGVCSCVYGTVATTRAGCTP